MVPRVSSKQSPLCIYDLLVLYDCCGSTLNLVDKNEVGTTHHQDFDLTTVQVGYITFWSLAVARISQGDSKLALDGYLITEACEPDYKRDELL